MTRRSTTMKKPPAGASAYLCGCGFKITGSSAACARSRACSVREESRAASRTPSRCRSRGSCLTCTAVSSKPFKTVVTRKPPPLLEPRHFTRATLLESCRELPFRRAKSRVANESRQRLACSSRSALRLSQLRSRPKVDGAHAGVGLLLFLWGHRRFVRPGVVTSRGTPRARNSCRRRVLSLVASLPAVSLGGVAVPCRRSVCSRRSLSACRAVLRHLPSIGRRRRCPYCACLPPIKIVTPSLTWNLTYRYCPTLVKRDHFGVGGPRSNSRKREAQTEERATHEKQQRVEDVSRNANRIQKRAAAASFSSLSQMRRTAREREELHLLSRRRRGVSLRL